ncbi:GGDEF domain-containing protein [Sphingomonas sp. PB4P5]|uniref:GGDEF domain-containing protein n=1 Tax=Parasphingomonas puruogangriensis TaxID=3096155 RepID=UPI002FCA4A53
MKFFPEIDLRNERDLARYVRRTTLLCVAIALTVDISNQLIFFVSWPEAARSWLLTTIVVVMIAVPVARKIGKVQVNLYRASTTDELTGILNRRAFLEGVDGSSFLALIIVDVDHFKNVNDRHGHWIGDQVLRATATMMEQSIGQLGRIGRLGGEEFALLANSDDHAVLLAALERFRETVAQTPILADAVSVSITISAGVATRDDHQTFERLFIRADRALYRAKALGRNKIVFADDMNADGDADVVLTGRTASSGPPGC